MKKKEKELYSLLILITILIIVLFGIYIYSKISEYYSTQDPKIQQLRNKFFNFFENKKWDPPLEKLNSKNLIETIKLYRGNKSYTINKEKVYICLKDKKGEYYSDNTLIYVMAHELAHVICDEIGHTDKFYYIFDILLLELEKEKLYNPHINIPDDYCKIPDDF